MISEQSRFPNNYLETQVYVRAGSEADLSGAMQHIATARTWKYKNLVELLMLYEALFNSEKYPQPTHELRDMTDEKKSREQDEMLLRNSVIGHDELEALGEPVFAVKVRHRQNASWQGSVEWLSKGLTKQFKSTLELVKLMGEAIGGAEPVGWDAAAE